MLFKRGLFYHDITYNTAITVTESESNTRITTDTPYLAPTGELWGVHCEDFGENWPCYDSTVLYIQTSHSHKPIRRSHTPLTALQGLCSCLVGHGFNVISLLEWDACFSMPTISLDGCDSFQEARMPWGEAKHAKSVALLVLPTDCVSTQLDPVTHKNAAENWVIIIIDNSLAPIQCQAIT